MTRASIVVPAYNVAAYLPSCLESICAQTETEIEVIVVDDGATDSTPEIADQFAQRDSRVQAIHQDNRGLSGARNSGLAIATGEFVFFIDGDDWIEPTTVEAMIEACESAAAEVSIAGAFVDFHDDADRLVRSEKRTLPGQILGTGLSINSDTFDDNVANLLGYAWNKCYRREWLNGLGVQFEQGLSLIEDLVFNAQVLAQAERVVMVADAFVHYVQRPAATLGTARNNNFLALRLRAVKNLDNLLSEWGLDDPKRTEQRARSSALALWAAIQASSSEQHSSANLARMATGPAAAELIGLGRLSKSAGWRGKWASYTLKWRLYSIARLPTRLLRAIRR